MTRETLWSYLLARNPGIRDGKAMTPAGYRKFFDLVWDQAQKDMRDKLSGDVPDFLKGMFR